MTPASAIVTTDLLVEHQRETGQVLALTCAAFSVAGGTSTAIMGPSGSGKSTLLGLLAGLALPTEGTITIGGDTISALSDRERVRFRRRVLGMVYQADNLLPHLTVEENVALQLAICRDTPTDRRSEPGALLGRLGLAALAERLPDQLSGGERQRVAVARAVVHGPRVILADEPTGALDDESGLVVIELLVEIHRETGATLIVVTHDPQIAAHLDRTVRLEGKVPTAMAIHAR